MSNTSIMRCHLMISLDAPLLDWNMLSSIDFASIHSPKCSLSIKITRDYVHLFTQCFIDFCKWPMYCLQQFLETTMETQVEILRVESFLAWNIFKRICISFYFFHSSLQSMEIHSIHSTLVSHGAQPLVLLVTDLILYLHILVTLQIFNIVFIYN